MDKEDMLELLKRPIAFHPVFSRIAGGATAGLFLSQLFYWTGKGADADGWIYKEAREFETETTLTVDEQRTARRKLKTLEILKEERRGLNPTIFYRLDLERLVDLISRERENPSRQLRIAHRLSRKSPPREGGFASALTTKTTADTTQIVRTQSPAIVEGGRIIINGECVATRSSMQSRIEQRSREKGISLDQAWQSISQEILDYANHHESQPPKKAARQGRG